jgi:uncharacterized damage-inducible protein DinB
MTVQEARTLINYTYWARDRVLAAADALSTEQFTQGVNSSFGSVRDTLVHVLSAETAWLSRWKGEGLSGPLTADAFPDLASIKKAWSDEEGKMRSFFETVDEAKLQSVIHYKAFNGQPFSNPLFQMLQHVINHGSYHRGQVTTLLRQFGAPPPKGLDLIVFYRETA